MSSDCALVLLHAEVTLLNFFGWAGRVRFSILYGRVQVCGDGLLIESVTY